MHRFARRLTDDEDARGLAGLDDRARAEWQVAFAGAALADFLQQKIERNGGTQNSCPVSGWSEG